MKRFRLVQVCNRLGRARLWVCPWLRDGWHPSQAFDEWIITLNTRIDLAEGIEYFVDIDYVICSDAEYLMRSVFITPAGTLSWAQIPPAFITSIKAPDADDLSNTETFGAPALPWVKSLQL